MKQPRALTPLFLTEMWERFGFYVVQSLLILYLTNLLKFSDSKSYLILGEYTALVYLTPIAGGIFSDRVLGPRYSILIGAVLLAVGYFLLAFNHAANHSLLFLGLAIIVIGNGFLKPNISSFLGEFYYEDDPRRNAGFTLFYMGINIGALLALGSGGAIQEGLGWWAAFGAAGIGMIIAFGTFAFGFSTFENRGLPVPRNQIPHKLTRLFSYKITIVISILISIVIAFLLISSSSIAEVLETIVGVMVLLALIYVATRYHRQQRNKFFALLILIVASVIFWGLFFQMFAAVNLFTERNVDRHMFGLTVPPSVFISLESFFILIFGPFLAWLWQHLHVKKIDPTPGMKFSLAMFCVAISMALLVLGIHFHQSSGFISPWWIVIFFIVITLGEMLLSPIGLSMVTELSPPHLSGLMMGVWFMALGFGGELSGYLAKAASVPKSDMNLAISNLIYAHAFRNNAIIAFVVAVVLLALTPWLKRLTKN
ncbi:peptide MFS transporter [Candidiatus Paracoxiella cheracis]|uniref:peptide MFS transporter n=1 Tax=Candidiatus Paracoxiella cheracis TaxID=3405120 RepID=UPI003BF60791